MKIRNQMGRWTHLAAALALSIAAGSASAQDATPLNEGGLEPLVAGQEVTQDEAEAINDPDESRTVSGDMTTEEAVEATPSTPETVPSVDGDIANAGTVADATLGQPIGGMGIQSQVTSLGEFANGFNTALLTVMGLVTLFVFGLLLWAMLRYRRKDGVAPSKTTHNVFIEVLWTLVPVLILVGIAIPSFGLLAAQYDPPEADVTVKAIGHQWYWEYEYPDEGGFSFDAIMLTDEQAAEAGEPRLLATDNRVVVPVGANVKVLVTSVDVLHSWAMPSFWVKMDAVPGRINETWFRAERTGVFYGQCSELCGTQHGFMPIVVEVVEQDVYDNWVASRQDYAGIDPADLLEEEEGFSAVEDEGLGVPTDQSVAVPDEAGMPAPTDTDGVTGTVIEQSATSTPSEVGEVTE
ncbi:MULTISPECIES: cytochrome c oxidase subunit II [Pacificimonas]|nr:MULTISPECIES: cytochrome c oxidase subunit II [Pacificimonas]MBZ6378069.1 cytochrome c oxidase subunit II [Pacificimonas aurantium]